MENNSSNSFFMTVAFQVNFSSFADQKQINRDCGDSQPRAARLLPAPSLSAPSGKQHGWRAHSKGNLSFVLCIYKTFLSGKSICFSVKISYILFCVDVVRPEAIQATTAAPGFQSPVCSDEKWDKYFSSSRPTAVL
ncbi:hypothetical protein GX408_04590 [bacterium]|nr:hypothetical protein [bacterium]